MNDAIRIHDEQAARYDWQARECMWFGGEILFGLSFDYVNPHDRLLDIGIGTGLSSRPFARVGLEIFGIDGSIEMLNICRAKDFARELRHFDLQSGPLPYSDASFDHVISCGVFHFFGDLRPLFREISRVIKPDGIFAFTIQVNVSEQGEEVEGYSETSSSDTPVFMHGDSYIEKLLRIFGFDRLRDLKFLARSGQKDSDDLLCRAYVAQRKQ